MNGRGQILLYILFPVLLLSAAASYYRFVVASDYIVEYEGECDPSAQSCFEGCEDDECTETYAYAVVRKYASDVRAQCGPDITDCEAASICQSGDRVCTIGYCDPSDLGVDEACAVYEEEEPPDDLGDDAREGEELVPEETVEDL